MFSRTLHALPLLLDIQEVDPLTDDIPNASHEGCKRFLCSLAQTMVSARLFGVVI